MSVTETDRPASKLKQNITGSLLCVFILGDVLGAGIYALTGMLAQEVGGAVWVPLAVALGLALLTAGSCAELVTKYPRAGGRPSSPSVRTAAPWWPSWSASACWPPG